MSDNPFADALATAGPDTAPAPVTAQQAPPAEAPSDSNPFAAALAGVQQNTAKQKSPEEETPVPSWSEIPGMAASNSVKSGGEFLGNIGHAVAHPIESAENLGSVGLGYMEKAGKHIGLPSGQGYEKYADAMNDMILKRYGSVDNFKRTLAEDPVGVLADASIFLTGGGSAAARLPGVAGKVGETVGALGRAVDPLNAITKPVGALAGHAGNVAKEIAGYRSGAGPEALEAAAQAGYKGGEEARNFRENLRQTMPIENVVRDAMGAVQNIVENKSVGYKQGMAQAGLSNPIAPSSFMKIAKGMQDASDVGHLKGFIDDPVAIKANQDLGAIVDHFVYGRPDLHTVEGLDALKQAIGTYTKDHIEPGSKSSVVGARYYDAVLGAIKDQAPKYAQVMDQYGEAKDLLNQIQKSLSLPQSERKLNIDTALRKLQSVMRNNVNTNYGFRKTLVEQLEANGAPNLRYSIAGQALSSKTPRGLARIGVENGAEAATFLIGLFSGNPALALHALQASVVSAATRSPRILGEGAYYAGRAASATKPIRYYGKPALRIAQQAGRYSQLPDTKE